MTTKFPKDCPAFEIVGDRFDGVGTKRGSIVVGAGPWGESSNEKDSPMLEVHCIELPPTVTSKDKHHFLNYDYSYHPKELKPLTPAAK